MFLRRRKPALSVKSRLKVALEDHVVLQRIVEHEAVLVPVLGDVAHAQQAALADGRMGDVLAARQ